MTNTEPLDKVKAALEMAAKHKYGDGDYTAYFEKALTELNKYMERLNSEQLVEDVAKAMFVPPISKYKLEDVRSAIEIIKGDRDGHV